jgi:predicted regulator of Ras-like GTPase activity (Roadblock/LC7/MglB family)
MFKLNKNQIDTIDSILRRDLIDSGVSCSILIDSAGNIISSFEDGCRQIDKDSIACLAAGNYGAVKAMANIMGAEDFALLFHMGKKMSIHLKNLSSEFLLINIFDQDLSLGLLRLKVLEVLLKMEKILPRPNLYIANNAEPMRISQAL